MADRRYVRVPIYTVSSRHCSALCVYAVPEDGRTRCDLFAAYLESDESFPTTRTVRCRPCMLREVRAPKVPPEIAAGPKPTRAPRAAAKGGTKP